jgi:hypothetical protein
LISTILEMFFFRQLEQIGIYRDNLKNISEEDIIKIEKKLIAESRLNASLTKNDIDLILKILKTYLYEIEKIALMYPVLYGILSGNQPEYIDKTKFHTKEQEVRIRQLLSGYFQESIFNYIFSNVQNNQWNNLLNLLYYREFLSLEIIQYLVQLLQSKIDSIVTILTNLPSHYVLHSKLKYLKRKPFYELLGQADADYFKPFAYTILKFIPANKAYTDGTRFFDNVLLNLRYIDSFDGSLERSIHMVYMKYGGQKAFVYYGVGVIILILISFILFLNSTLPDKNLPKPRTNFWSGDRNYVLGERGYRMEEQKIQLLNFEEAREHPINYPSLKGSNDTSYISKYEHPFEIGIFEKHYGYIKKGKKNLNIFNDTNKDCFVLAFYRRVFDTGTKEYINSRDLNSIYALYIPRRDSIKIDFEMFKLQFYLGNKLKKFNNYRAYVYPDSNDFKFSITSSLDSVLLKTSFLFDDTSNSKRKNQTLRLIQSADEYNIAWNGNMTIYTREKLGLEKGISREDSLKKTYPMIVRPLKHLKHMQP